VHYANTQDQMLHAECSQKQGHYTNKFYNYKIGAQHMVHLPNSTCLTNSNVSLPDAAGQIYQIVDIDTAISTLQLKAIWQMHVNELNPNHQQQMSFIGLIQDSRLSWINGLNLLVALNGLGVERFKVPSYCPGNCLTSEIMKQTTDKQFIANFLIEYGMVW
jgi:hypothetical protein